MWVRSSRSFKSHWLVGLQIYDANPQGGTDKEFWPTNKRNFKTFETARSPLDGSLRKIEIGWPKIYWEETLQNVGALSRSISKAVYGELNSQQALDEAAEEWAKMSRNLESITKSDSTRTSCQAQENRLQDLKLLLSVPWWVMILPSLLRLLPPYYDFWK